MAIHLPSRIAEFDLVGGWNSNATRRDRQRGHMSRSSRLDSGMFGPRVHTKVSRSAKTRTKAAVVITMPHGTMVMPAAGERRPTNAKPADEGGLIAVPTRTTRWSSVRRLRWPGGL